MLWRSTRIDLMVSVALFMDSSMSRAGENRRELDNVATLPPCLR